MKNYIRYHETEKLYAAWPTLEAIFESLCVDLRKENTLKGINTQDEYIYALTMRTRGYNDMPKGEWLTDKTGELAISYNDIIQRELKGISNELRDEYFVISTVLDKLVIAYKRLTPLVRAILEMYYWDGRTWDEIVTALEPKDQYMSKAQAQRYRRKGIEKMRVILKVTIDDYERVMCIATQKEGEKQ